jgi:hypothetical protein
MKTLELVKPDIIRTGVAMGMEGVVQCKIVDSKTGQVVKEFPPQKNLILNQGMDELATNNLCNLFLRCAAGSGTTPTADDSGTTTAAQSGTTVTLSGGSFVFTNTATDAGKMIKWDSTEEARIVTVTDPTHAEVANSATVSAGQFTVYRTNQTGLTTELKRTGTYLAGAGNCETSVNAGAGSASHKRTYDFTAEVGSVTYNELGFSSNASAGANLFSRILLGAGVSLVASQQLRVVYTLTMTFTPFTSQTVGTSPITGIAGATGAQQCGYPATTAILTSSGATDQSIPAGSTAPSASEELEPSRVTQTMALSTVSTAFQTFGSTGVARNGSLSGAGAFVGSYTALSFTRTKAWVFSTSQGNGTTWRSFILGNGDGYTLTQGLIYLLDSNMTKDNTHTLTLNLILTWGRTLA